DESSLVMLVCGGGFTGIELLGELVEKVPQLCKKYDIDRSKVRIINVEASPSLLAGFDPELVEYAKESLETRGVEFYLNAKITECTTNGFVVGDDNEEIKAGTVIWTGGVTGNSVLGKSGFELNRGKVSVTEDLRDPNSDHIFVLENCAWVMNKESDRPYPPTAQIAIQQADYAAENIKALLNREPLSEFVFDNKGTVASLENKDEVGSIFDDKK